MSSSPTDQQLANISLLRAFAFLRTQQYDAALRDLEFLTSLESGPSDKALYYKSQVLYNIQRFGESYLTEKLLCDTFPEHFAAKGKLRRVIARFLEQQRARYQFKQMRHEASQRRPPLLDRATYSRYVIVKDTGDHRGRGLFTTAPIKAGDLLLCEKAFEYAFYDANDKTKPISVTIDTATGKIVKGTQVELIKNIVQKVFSNPSLIPCLTNLYHSSYTPVNVTKVDARPVVDR